MTLIYSFNMHKSVLPFRGNRLHQISLGSVMVLIFLCVDICEPSGNKGTKPSLMTTLLLTSTSVGPRARTPTSKPISTPRLSNNNSPTARQTDKSTTSQFNFGGLIPIVSNASQTMDTNNLGYAENTPSSPIKSDLHDITNTGTESTKSYHLDNLKSSSIDHRLEGTQSKPVLPSPEPSRSVTTLALSPTPSIDLSTMHGGNKPSVSSHFTGSGAVARKTFTRPSPTLIDPPVLSTSGPRLPYTKGTRAPTRRINVLSPTPTPYPTVAQPHRCPLGKGSRMECICMNCEGNTSPGLMCCTEQLYRNDMEQGIALIISSFPMMGFLPKVASLRKLAEELINDECSKTRCFDDKIVRKKRNAKEFDYGTPIKRWDGSPITPTNAVRPNSKRDAASTAPRIQKPLDVNVVMFKISQHPSENRDLYTAFYASVDGTNETQILNADVLERLVRSKKSLLERGLNITIDRVSQWRAFRDKYSIGPKSVSSTVASSSSSSISPGGGSPSIENPQASNSTANMSKSTFIIVLVLGIGGFVVLAIIIIYMLVKFLRRMKGEFVPDKAYPNEQKSEAGSDQLIPSFIDPSTPRITDVPKKTVRQPTAANSSGVAPGGGGVGGPGGPGGSTTGGNSGGTKKAKKPMGVKVTYKPPKWD